MGSLLRVVAWMDGRPGDESQIEGILGCLPEAAAIHRVEMPPANPVLERRLGVWALGIKHLHVKPPVGLLEELLGARWDAAVKAGPQLSIAAGSRGGLYSFALGRMEWCSTVQAMTHSLLKTAFTLNVVPAHDRTPAGRSVLVTTTAPNPYLPPIAHRLGREFREEHHLPAEGYYWALLMGGLIRHQPETDLDPSSMAAEVKSLLRTAEEHGATLLVSTSRRSPPAVVDALAEVLSGHPLVAFFQDFRTDPRRTTGHLLGVATQAFLTPDSVSMISETLWAGRGLTLIPMVRDRQSQPVVPTPKHRRFLENIQAQGQGRWFGPSWEPPRTRVDLEYRHPDFLAIQSRLRELLRDVPR